MNSLLKFIAHQVLGGPATLRPDHAMLIAPVGKDLGDGQRAVVVRPSCRDQDNRASNAPEHWGGDETQTP